MITAEKDSEGMPVMYGLGRRSLELDRHLGGLGSRVRRRHPKRGRQDVNAIQA
jgi:hypothetical protein